MLRLTILLGEHKFFHSQIHPVNVTSFYFAAAAALNVIVEWLLRRCYCRISFVRHLLWHFQISRPKTSHVHKSFKYTRSKSFATFWLPIFFFNKHLCNICIPVGWLHLIPFDMVFVAARQSKKHIHSGTTCLKEENLRQINLYPILYWLLNLSMVVFFVILATSCVTNTTYDKYSSI